MLLTAHRRVLAATLAFAIALSVLVWLGLAAHSGGGLATADALVATWLNRHAAPPMTQAMIIVSFLGAPSTLSVITVLIGVALALRRRYGALLRALTLVFGGNLLNYTLKHVVHRSRPVFEHPLLTLSSDSFPSGHAMASTVFYGFVVAGVLIAPHDARRTLAVGAGIIMIALVSFSRIYLGVHYMSDVIAGVAEAIAWSLIIMIILPSIGDHLQHRHTSPPD